MNKKISSEIFETVHSASRRDVIKTIGAGSAALLFSPQTLLSASRKKKDRLGVALVGLGYYSTDLLAPALQQTKNCYLAGIVTGTPSKAETWKRTSTYLIKTFTTTRLLTRLPTILI